MRLAYQAVLAEWSPKRELGFAGVEIAAESSKFGVAVALEAVAGQDVEDAVGAVADVGGVTAALGFELVDVLGIDLRADVGGDLGVGDGDAVDEPTGLVAAAHVQHVVGHVGAGDVVGDHLHAQGAAGAGGFIDLWRVMSVVGVTESVAEACYAAVAVTTTDSRGLAMRQRNVQDRVGARGNGDGLGTVGEARGAITSSR